MQRNIRGTLYEAISEMPIVNHHEHAWNSFSPEHAEELDLPYFLYQDYLAGDLAAAGLVLPPGLFDYLQDPALPDGSEQAWAVLYPYLAKVRSTSYFRYLLRGLSDLFDVGEKDIFSERWRACSERIRHYSRENRGAGAKLSARMHVAATVLDAKVGIARVPAVEAGAHEIVHVARLDWFIHEERGLAETLGTYGHIGFEDWLAAFDTAFHDSLLAGAKGIKSGLAYNRRIEYAEPSQSEASRIYREGLLTATVDEKTVYQDFMMNRLCQHCVEAGVPLQIHTGLQGGTRHVLEDTRPTLLTSLFRRYPDLKVDLFHGGFPWCIQAGLMAKYFPNVYIDGCWLHHISPSAFRAALTSWIETVPMSKILAWGGDHTILEHSYASLLLARDLVADVLAELVTSGYFDLELALEVARRIMHDNGAELWGLGV